MKISVSIIFYTVFFIVYTSLNLLILVRASQASQSIKWLKFILIAVVTIGYVSFLAAMVLEKTNYQGISSLFKWLSSYWLAYMLYILLPLLIIDILRLANYVVNFSPDFITNNYIQTKLIILSTVFLISTIVIIIGRKNASNTKINEIAIDVLQKNSDLESLKILFASDIHLGATINKTDAQRLADIARLKKPDIILLGGDILDSDVRPAISNNSGEPFKELNPPMGVYAITGNHEYIGGDINKAADYIENLNIKLIRDNVVNVNNSFYLVGREDRDMLTFTAKERVPKDELLAQVNDNLPIILMDHQPFKLEESFKLGVDLHLSGHTHNGQMWPINYITEAIFEKSWGYIKKGNSHFYVSCGFGVWGPKVRIGSYSEVVIININFVDKPAKDEE